MPDLQQRPISLLMEGMWIHLLMPDGVMQRCYRVNSKKCIPVKLVTSKKLVAMTKMDANASTSLTEISPKCSKDCSICVSITGVLRCICTMTNDYKALTNKCISPLMYKLDPCFSQERGSPCGPTGQCVPKPPPKDYLCR